MQVSRRNPLALSFLAFVLLLTAAQGPARAWQDDKKLAAQRAYQEADRLAQQAGQAEAALKKFEEASRLFEEAGSNKDAGYMLLFAARVAYDREDLRAVSAYCQKSLQLLRGTPDSEKPQAFAWSMLGAAARAQKQHQDALDAYWNESLLWQQLDNKAALCRAYHNLALTYQDLGDEPNALDGFSKALELVNELPDAEEKAALYRSTGQYYLELGETEGARGWLQVAAGLYQRLGRVEEARPLQETVAKLRAQAAQPARPAPDEPSLVVQLGHDSFVMCLAFAPDGKFIVTGSQDGTARLWDAATQREIRSFNHGALVQGVAWTPDGQSIATAGLDGTVRLWGRDSGRQIRVLTAAREEMTSVAVSPDGKLIAAGNGDAAQLWDLATGRRIHRITLPPRVNAVLFSRDGRHLLLASGADYDPSKVPPGANLKPLPSVIAVFEAETGREIWRFQGHASPVKAAALSADGKLVLTGSGGIKSSDNTARLLDSATGRELRVLRHDAPVISVSLTADGQRALTISVDERARVWDTASGQLLATINRVGESLYSGAFAAEGHLLALGETRNVSLFTPAGEAQGTLAGYTYNTSLAAFSPDGRFIATANSYSEKRRDYLETGGAVCLWDTLTGREEQRLSIKDFGVETLAYSSDGRFLVSGQGYSATLWEVNEGREVRRFDAPDISKNPFSTLTAVALSRDNKFLLLGFGSVTELGKEGHYVCLWDTATGRMLRRVALEAAVNSVAFAPDGAVWLVGVGAYVFRAGALVEQPQAVVLLDAQTGQVIRRLAGNRGVFAPDGKQILTNGKDGVALLYDAAPGRQLREFPSKNQADIKAMAFAADGRRFITGDEKGMARVWDTGNGELVDEFAARAGGVKAVGLTPDGKTALTLHSDNAVRLWNLSGGGRELCRLLSFRDGSWVVADATGRFDASDLTDLRGLHWLLPDNPVTPLPLEIFQRQYYEPRLLPRLLANEKFKPLPSLAELNRAQPVVKISKIEAAEEAGRVNVTVEVANAKSTQKHGSEAVKTRFGSLRRAPLPRRADGGLFHWRCRFSQIPRRRARPQA